MVAAVARNTSTEGFGAFAVAYLAYRLLLGLFRAGFGDALLVSAQRLGKSRHSLPGFLAAAALVGVLSGLVSGIASLIAQDAIGASFGALAVVAPIVMLQDACRYALIALKRSQSAIITDVVWIVLQVCIFVLVAQHGTPTAASLIFAWGVAAAPSAAYGLIALRTLPRLSSATQWLRSEGQKVTAFTADYFAKSGTSYAAFFAVPVVGGLTAIGALRGAQLLFAPVEIFLSGARFITLPFVGRELKTLRPTLWVRLAEVGAWLAAAAAAWGVVVLVMPASIGRSILGATWSDVAPLVGAFCIVYLARSVGAVGVDIVRASPVKTHHLFVVRLTASTIVGVSLIVGVALEGALGGAIGLAVSELLAAGVWWAVASRIVQNRRRASEFYRAG